MPEPELSPAAPDLEASLDALIDLIDQENRLLRTGRIREGLQAQGAKDDAARALQAALRKATAPRAPTDPTIAALADRQRRLERHLAENLAILATLRSVAETILRDVSHSLSARPPSAYGPAARRQGSVPLALSRST